MTPFTMLGMGLAPSSFFFGFGRLGMSSRCVVDSSSCSVAEDFFQCRPLTYLLLILGINLEGCTKSEENVVLLS